MGNLFKLDIKPVLEKFNIKNFIETGTLYGDCIKNVLYTGHNFDKIYTIEIVEILAESAGLQFGDNKTVSVINSNSVDGLVQIFDKELKGPTMFWLDAHFPGVDSGHNNMNMNDEHNMPLKEELELIKKHRSNCNDVIIMDDMWIFKDFPELPVTFDQHMINHGRTLRRSHLTNEDSIDWITDMFKDTHTSKTVLIDQGFLILFPKISNEIN